MAKKNSRKGPKDPNNNVVATNRRARHDYNILDRYEAGMVLTGTEVKSLREGQASLTDGFAAFSSGGELWLEQVHIPEYLNGTWTNHSARRKRKLLLHHKELVKITRQIESPGHTIVPLQLYFKDGRAKVEIGIAQGKREFDKRETLRRKQDERDAQRAMRYRNRGAA
ncbi:MULTISPECIES: SsrA-binding protein SmpB [Nesterenkonia]|uniref:SsrA-binding protein n=1 Tax=Nesterenkonia xinjiangensis TaxID=225327 RepID=A0A7Z0GNI4_9MICC|nr:MULTISPECIES: SsrA-binding protein SmpB [Nesterenkonia]MDZ5076032.1 SsrA-binding protein SmpB [Nesterenkonia sp. HG001]NYJ79197.1 SsrA-binding protein [Nesterenkonia xinjiangensis]